MEYYNIDTKKIEKLSYIVNGCDCLSDICDSHLGSDKTAWYEDTDSGLKFCEASNEDIIWWSRYIANDTRATELMLECREDGLSDDEEREMLCDAGCNDMETQPLRVIELLTEWMRSR